MIEFFTSAWCDFWHVMWLMRLGFIVLGVVSSPFILFAIFVSMLGRDGWR